MVSCNVVPIFNVFKEVVSFRVLLGCPLGFHLEFFLRLLGFHSGFLSGFAQLVVDIVGGQIQHMFMF